MHRHLQVQQRETQRLLQRHRPEGLGLAPDPRILQQIDDQPVHALGAVAGEVDALPRLLVQRLAQAALQQGQVAGDDAQGLAQVVRGDVGEGLQLGVGAFKLARLAAKGVGGQAAFGDVVDQRHQHGAAMHDDVADIDLDIADVAGGQPVAELEMPLPGAARVMQVPLHVDARGGIDVLDMHVAQPV